MVSKQSQLRRRGPHARNLVLLFVSPPPLLDPPPSLGNLQYRCILEEGPPGKRLWPDVGVVFITLHAHE